MALYQSDTACAVADGKIGFVVPASMNGMDLSALVASCTGAVGTTGTMDVQVRRLRAGAEVNMLSVALTIDSGEWTNLTAETGYTIDTDNDDLATGDVIFFDVDGVHTTPAEGLTITATAA